MGADRISGEAALPRIPTEGCAVPPEILMLRCAQIRMNFEASDRISGEAALPRIPTEGCAVPPGDPDASLRSDQD
jgi:hypothetical protein